MELLNELCLEVRLLMEGPRERVIISALWCPFVPVTMPSVSIMSTLLMLTAGGGPSVIVEGPDDVTPARI